MTLIVYAIKRPRCLPMLAIVLLSVSASAKEAEQQLLLTLADTLSAPANAPVYEAAARKVTWRDALRDLQRNLPVNVEKQWELSSVGERLVLLSVTSDGDVDEVLSSLRRNPWVTAAERVKQFHLLTHIGDRVQSTHQESARDLQVTPLRAEAARRWSTGSGISVALLGGHPDERHPDLRDALTDCRHYARGAAAHSDVRATAIASVVAGARSGIAPDARLLSFSTCKASGDRTLRSYCDTPALSRALDEAINRQVDAIYIDVIGTPDAIIAKLIDAALARRIVVVATAGNNTIGNFPATADGVVAVSRRAPADAGESNVLLGPGDALPAALPSGRYGSVAGDAIATAAVTGVIALVLQRKPHLPAGLIRELLVSTAHPDSRSVDACAALSRVVGVPCR